mmetsp:Transcript_25264/g.55226  ORF Transcript_25264/g.55226 Transcript_25264/m.55226 type:complete len:357 (+) Transcript_25264:182-1252(+)
MSSTAEILFSARAPYEIVWASPAWLEMCGYSAEHIIGRSIRTLRGPGTNKSTILRIFESIQSCTPISELRLVNYDQHRRPFSHTVAVTPLKDAYGDVTLVRVTSSNVMVLSTTSGTCATEMPRRRQDCGGMLRAAGRSRGSQYNLSTLTPPGASCELTDHLSADELQKVMHLSPDDLSDWLAGDDVGDWLSADVAAELPLVHPANRIHLPPDAFCVITEAEAPYHVVFASEAWLSLCGFSACEIAGRAGLSCIQGPGTNRLALAKLMAHVRKQEPLFSLPLINYDKNQNPFSHELTIVPLQAPDGTAYLKATSASVYRREAERSEEDEDDQAATNCWGDTFEDFFSSFEAMSQAVV